MALVSAKCTNCGGVLEVDNKNEAAVCKYCGTPFIVEKAINNYVQNISIEHATINVQGPDFENYLVLIKRAILHEELEEAQKYLSIALPYDPNNEKLRIYKFETECLKFRL